MNLIMVAPHFPLPTNTGSKTRTYNLLKRLGARHNVSFACIDRGEVAEPDLAELGRVCSRLRVIRGAPVSRARQAAWLMSGRPYHVSMFWSASLESVVRGMVEAPGADAVLSSFLYMARALPARLPAGMLAAVDQHNLDRVTWDGLRRGDPSPLVRLAAGWNYRKTCRYELQQYRRFDLCFSVSEEDAAATRLIAPAGLPVRVASNGVDVEAFRPAADGWDGEADSLLFFGTMNARMNADAVVYLVEEILPLIRTRRPGARLSIVGQNPSASVLKLGQRPGVSVLGEVPDVRPHVAAASVVMAPVRMGGGTKVKVLESMSMGRPVVATSHACRGLAVQDGVDVSIADSPAEIAGRTVALLEDAEARRRMGAAARATVERLYSWDAIAALISDEMEVALERKREAAGGRV